MSQKQCPPLYSYIHLARRAVTPRSGKDVLLPPPSNSRVDFSVMAGFDTEEFFFPPTAVIEQGLVCHC
ncbi:hypothetical protein JTE90_022734 [Oedothorax gibbosus]|uniref:Uncharacterized protein n=1 Tax=Oedothorax gibbosus TaxID=931172 RepID=A0AAV6URB5_9ARAC|nr:hypothetical protein JTE90_022734 [Oedothorax gibbosus]